MTARKVPEELRRDVRQAALWLCDLVAHFEEEKFRKGDKGAVLRIVSWYLVWDALPPEWARKAFFEACQSDPKSWDAVFGKPRGDGWRKKEEMQVRREAERMRAQGRKIDAKDFFHDLGKNTKKSTGTAKRRYYGEMKSTLDKAEAVMRELRLTPEDFSEWGEIVALLAIGDDLAQILERARAAQLRSQESPPNREVQEVPVNSALLKRT